MGFLCHETTRQVSMIVKWIFQKHNLSGHPCRLFLVLLLLRKFLLVSSLPSYFSKGFSGSIESGWDGETGSINHSNLGPRLCTDLCASNYQCVGVLSKKLGLRFLLFFSVYCGLCFKWDANVIYSAWHDAVRENWTLQGNANLSREGLHVSNMFLWVTKEQSSMAYGETGSKQHVKVCSAQWRWLLSLWSGSTELMSFLKNV